MAGMTETYRRWRTGALTRHEKNMLILQEMEFERTEKEWASYKYLPIENNRDLEDENLDDCFEDDNFILAYDILGRRINKKEFYNNYSQIT